MSILIKGMKMPKKCDECPLGYEEDIKWYACSALGLSFRNPNGRIYPDECPLVEVKVPHGRLIDVDSFKTDWGMGNDCEECDVKMSGKSRSCEYDRVYTKMDFCGWLDDAPTVIEAEGET